MTESEQLTQLAHLTAKIDHIHIFLKKFDDTVTHLHDLVSSIDKVLALQEQRLESYEKQQEVLHQRIYSVKEEYESRLEKLRDARNLEHKEVMDRIVANEKELAKWKWLVLGGFGVLSAVAALLGIDFTSWFGR